MMAGPSEAVLNGFNAFSGAFYGPASSLQSAEREVAILRVGYLSNAKYETFQHEAAAKLAELDDSQIQAIRRGDEHRGVLTSTQQGILNFTDNVVKNVRANDAKLDGARKLLSDKQVLDLTLLVGLYMTVSRLLETAGVELDVSTLDWKHVVPQ
jgi:4-carboxymuconolactone decarboxylase